MTYTYQTPGEEVMWRRLDKRANAVGYQLVPCDLKPRQHWSMGGGPYAQIFRDGELCFEYPWSALEIEQWLSFREHDQRQLREAA